MRLRPWWLTAEAPPAVRLSCLLEPARFIPAVDYSNTNRLRPQAMRAWAELFRNLDVIVTPTFAPNQLLATNLTGHPALILPNGYREDGTPVSIAFLGDLFGKSQILALGHAYQSATDFHRRQPALRG